jgi:hypothetical protein
MTVWRVWFNKNVPAIGRVMRITAVKTEVRTILFELRFLQMMRQAVAASRPMKTNFVAGFPSIRRCTKGKACTPPSTMFSKMSAKEPNRDMKHPARRAVPSTTKVQRTRKGSGTGEEGGGSKMLRWED